MTKPERYIITELGTEKFCTRCGQYWPMDAEFFHREKDSNDGFNRNCIACRREMENQSVEKASSPTVKSGAFPAFKRKERRKFIVDVPKGYKFCPDCKRVLPLDNFAGNNSYCKPCKIKRTQEYRARQRAAMKQTNPTERK